MAQSVLVIDDNKEITGVLGKTLRLKKYDVTVENSGKDGINILEHSRFDIIILDLAMPEITGYDIISKLENEGRLNESRIIILTASRIQDDDRSNLESKVFVILEKPIDFQKLFENMT